MVHFKGNSHPFDDPGRRNWQNPEAILASIGLKPGMTFADIGCGGGFFTIPAARITGETGKVYGLDNNPAAIKALQKTADAEGLNNLSLTTGKAEDILFCERCADFVFFGISFHDFQNQLSVIRNARLMIKPGGRLIDLDWKKEDLPVGPPAQIKFDKDIAVRIISAAGFKIASVEESGPYHYLITAIAL